MMKGENMRVMPDKEDLGRPVQGPMSSAMRFRGEDRFDNPQRLRTVMGFILPPWQRGFVWTTEQCVSFVESCWKGVPLGSYTVNISGPGSAYDGWLIDGQQRMRALERYFSDEFPVFDHRWSDITVVDRRAWEMGIIFNFFETRTDDEQYLRDYYNLMNFGGTAHKETERA